MGSDFQCVHPPRRSRKERYCYWCWEVIAVGDLYYPVVGSIDNQFYSDPQHPECTAAMSRMTRPEEWHGPYERGCTPDESDLVRDARHQAGRIT